MKWAEMTPEERDRLVDEHVMDIREMQMRVRVDSEATVIYRRDHDGNVLDERPRYSQSMDGAWKVFLHMMERYHPLRHQIFDKQGLVFRHFFDELVWFDDRPMAVYGDEIYPSEVFFEIVAEWTPENICLAALKAVGVEIE